MQPFQLATCYCSRKHFNGFSKARTRLRSRKGMRNMIIQIDPWVYRLFGHGRGLNFDSSASRSS